MHITSHNLRSVISRSLDRFPSLVGWCFLFCSVFKDKKSYIVWEYYKHSLFVLSVYQLLSTLWILLIYLMKDLSTLLALEHVAYVHSKGFWMTLWRSFLWLLFCNPICILTKCGQKWEIAAMRWWPAASVWYGAGCSRLQNVVLMFQMVPSPSFSLVSLLGNKNLCASRQCNVIGKASSQPRAPVRTRMLSLYSSRHVAHHVALFSHCSYPFA